MAFYDLSKNERENLFLQIYNELKTDIVKNTISFHLKTFSDKDTYIRKCGYLAIGRIYFAHIELRSSIISILKVLYREDDCHIRQTTVNAAGEIAMKAFKEVQWAFEEGLKDKHHTVRNAVIGSIKKAGQKNPEPVLSWAKLFLIHPDKEIRREICHGIELRGRTHPHDILPLLRMLEHDKTSRVKNTLIHVLGQIAYKKGCLEIVVQDLRSWKNKEIIQAALHEILIIHDRYKNFSYYTTDQAANYIKKNYTDV